MVQWAGKRKKKTRTQEMHCPLPAIVSPTEVVQECQFKSIRTSEKCRHGWYPDGTGRFFSNGMEGCASALHDEGFRRKPRRWWRQQIETQGHIVFDWRLLQGSVPPVQRSAFHDTNNQHFSASRKSNGIYIHNT